MAKKASQSSAAQNASTQNTSAESLWVATNLIEPRDNNVSLIKKSTLNVIKSRLGQGVVVATPKSNDRADSFREGWVCLYYYPFDISIPFPFSDVIKDVLICMRVSPGKLMPFAWRTLACLEAIENKHHLGINADVVKCCYKIKKFYGVRFGFSHRRKSMPLILNVEGVNDRYWKESFCYVEKSTLGEESSYFLERWNSVGTFFFPSYTSCVFDLCSLG